LTRTTLLHTVLLLLTLQLLFRGSGRHDAAAKSHKNGCYTFIAALAARKASSCPP
jgi:hypothetical protein